MFPFPQPKSKKSSKKQTVKYVIDCYIPVEDRVLDPASFEKFLHDRIKVNGKAGQLGDVISISREKVTKTAHTPVLGKRKVASITHNQNGNR